MTKQRGRGGKRGRKGKKGMGGKRDMVFKEEGQEYGQITKLLGNGTATVMCIDGRPRLGVICGRMKNRVWIQPNDIVLVSSYVAALRGKARPGLPPQGTVAPAWEGK